MALATMQELRAAPPTQAAHYLFLYSRWVRDLAHLFADLDREETVMADANVSTTQAADIIRQRFRDRAQALRATEPTLANVIQQLTEVQ